MKEQVIAYFKRTKSVHIVGIIAVALIVTVTGFRSYTKMKGQRDVAIAQRDASDTKAATWAREVDQSWDIIISQSRNIGGLQEQVRVLQEEKGGLTAILDRRAVRSLGDEISPKVRAVVFHDTDGQ